MLEVFDKKLVDVVNAEKYTVKTALQYLQEFNAKLKDEVIIKA